MSSALNELSEKVVLSAMKQVCALNVDIQTLFVPCIDILFSSFSNWSFVLSLNISHKVSVVLQNLVLGGGDLGLFPGQVKLNTRVANGLSSLRRFFGTVLPGLCAVKTGPATRSTLRHIAPRV